MTRQEFLDNINSWGDLVDFCYNTGCDYCEDIFDDDQRDDYINEQLGDMARNDTWREMLETLQSYYEDSGYSYYRRDDYGEWHILDDNDFDAYKDDVCEWMDNNEYWDSEEDEEEIPVIRPPEDTTPIETEEFSLNELFLAGISACNELIEEKEDTDIERLFTE